MERTVLITGANRGIGLALAKTYVSAGWRVFAACRAPQKAAELAALGAENLQIVPLDVGSEASAEQAAKLVATQTQGLDVLINNAAIGGGLDDHLATLDIGLMQQALDINVLGPLRTTRAFVGLLKKSASPKVINISSGLGCVGVREDSSSIAYGSSKAALNYVTRCLAIDLASENIIVTAINPGWVRTDMGGPNAPLLPEKSAADIAKVAQGLTKADSGRWFNWDGTLNEIW